jgi:hypothetical protein
MGLQLQTSLEKIESTQQLRPVLYFGSTSLWSKGSLTGSVCGG